MIYEILFSLSGIVLGYILGMLAVEELHDGKKYFLLVKRILFIAIILFSEFIFIKQNDLLFLLPLLMAGIILFVILLKNKKNLYLEIISYLLFIVTYFLIPEYKLLLATLIFLYGFPVGLLIKYYHYDKQKRS